MAPAAYVGAAAAAGSLALNVSNSMGGSGVPSVYKPGNLGYQDQSYNNVLQSMNNNFTGLPGQVLPQYQQVQQNISNNPYASLAQQGANQAGALAPGVSGMQMGGANALYGAGNQLLSTAFDPQSQLYNRTQQQTMDQINAANAASGLAGPAAAGVAQQGLTNFNIDWQNNLLQRQALGTQSAGQAFSGASGLGQQGMDTLQSGSNIPYATYLGQQQDIYSGLSGLSSGYLSAFAPEQQQIQDIQSYLGMGLGANGAVLAQNQQAFDQAQQNGAGLASAVSGFGNNSTIQSALSGLFGAGGGGGTTNAGGVTTGYNPSSFNYSNDSFGDLMAA